MKHPIGPWSPDGMADDLRNAYYAKAAGRFEDLLSVLERQSWAPDNLATQLCEAYHLRDTSRFEALLCQIEPYERLRYAT